MPKPRNMTRKPGCTPCRERHLRCDRAQPTCSSCSRARYPLRCDYGAPALKYRPSVYSSEGHGTRSAGYQGYSSPEERLFAPSPARYGPAEEPITREETSKAHDGYILNSWHTETSPADGIHGSVTESGLADVHQQPSPSDVALLQPSAPLVAARTPIANPPVIAPRECRRLVTDSVEAKLFDFYVKNTGPWLDIVSPSRYFGEAVPRMALTDSTLYYACLAYSARVLTLAGDLERNVGDAYEDKAIAQLIPRLSDEGLFRSATLHSAEEKTDATLPATTVILRMAEQFAEIRDDARCHLLGATSIFAGTDPNNVASASLGGDASAAFWVYMRQSIRVSFLNEEPCRFGAGTALLHVDVTPAPDEAWTNRMTYLLARTCSACWDEGLGPELRMGLLDKLQASLELWVESIPETFRPWCEFWSENDSFPIVRYICPWHVIGWQYYYAAKVLIGIHKKPEEMNMFDMTRYMEAEVLAPAHRLCAITFACDHVGVSINGTHLVSWCGQLSSMKKEQDRLIQFLQDFMHKTKWPNQTCCDRLLQIWSGRRKSWVES